MKMRIFVAFLAFIFWQSVLPQLLAWVFVLPPQYTIPQATGATAPGAAAIALDTPHCVQDNGGASSTTASCTLTSVPAGDAITCEVVAYQGTHIDSLNDATNGAYSFLHYTVNTSAHLTATAYMQNAAAATVTPTVTADDSEPNLAISCQAWKKTRTSLIVDTGAVEQEQSVTSNTANPTSGSTQTPANNGELVLGYAGMHANTPTAGTNYVLTDSATTSLGFPEYWVQTTATATNTPYTATTDKWVDQQSAFLPSAASAPTNTPPTGAAFTERWNLGAASCWTSGPSTCDNTWTIESGTGQSLVSNTWSPVANTTGTQSLQVTSVTTNHLLLSVGITTIASGTTYDYRFSFMPISTTLSGSAGTDIVEVCSTATDSSCPSYVEFYNSGNGFEIRATGSTSSTGVPVEFNSWYYCHVHIQSGTGNSYLNVASVGGGSVQNTFTAAAQASSYVSVGDPSDSHSKTFLVGNITVN